MSSNQNKLIASKKLHKGGLNLVAVSLWEFMISRMILMLLLLIIERILVPFKKKATLFHHFFAYLWLIIKLKSLLLGQSFCYLLSQKRTAFLKKYICLYIFREGKRSAWRGGGEQREGILGRLHNEHGALCGASFHNPEIVT